MEQIPAMEQPVVTESPQNPMTSPSNQPQEPPESLQLREFMEQERTKYDRENKLKAELKEKEERIKDLESEKSGKPVEISGEIKLKEREIMLDLKEFLLDNKDKYPLILATHNSPVVFDEMKRFYSQNKRGMTFEEACSMVESRIEDFEIKKAERLRGTPLYNKLYGNKEQDSSKETSSTITQPQEVPKARVIPKINKNGYRAINEDKAVLNPIPKGDPISKEEAHRMAHEAYLKTVKRQ